MSRFFENAMVDIGVVRGGQIEDFACGLLAVDFEEAIPSGPAVLVVMKECDEFDYLKYCKETNRAELKLTKIVYMNSQ